MLAQFRKDIEVGLSSAQKRIPSKYFYDATGDRLFQQIMAMPEYYLTNAELEIFQTQAMEMIKGFEINPSTHFKLIDLGAGDGTKTLELLKLLLAEDFNFSYLPIDISQNALDGVVANFSKILPTLNIETQQGSYFEVLETLSVIKEPKVLLFMGSNLGNMRDEEAADFMRTLSKNLSSGDKLLLGLDLIKSRDIVLPAYNDSYGITQAFNLNVLERINQELGADFVLDNFEHSPEYMEETGLALSYLTSLVQQKVSIEKLNKVFYFEKGERIFTEISRKYNDDILEKIIAGAGLSLTHKFMDSNQYFADYILSKSDLAVL